MRVNAQEEKRKHGITCHTSSPLEKGRAEGAGWMCLEEAPFYAAINDWKFQTGNLLSIYLRALPHI